MRAGVLDQRVHDVLVAGALDPEEQALRELARLVGSSGPSGRLTRSLSTPSVALQRRRT